MPGPSCFDERFPIGFIRLFQRLSPLPPTHVERHAPPFRLFRTRRNSRNDNMRPSRRRQEQSDECKWKRGTNQASHGKSEEGGT